MANKLYSILPGIAEDFYSEFINGDRSNEFFQEYHYLRELCSRIKDKITEGTLAADGLTDAKVFIKYMEETVIPNVSPDEERYKSLKAFW